MMATPIIDEEKNQPPLTKISSSPSEGSHHPVRLDPYGIPLHPAPTEDELDPLNWSKPQKYLILFIVSYAAFLCVYMTGTPIESFFLLEELFDASYSQVNWTLAIPSLGLATGPLLVSSLADIWGRRPILIMTCALTMFATGCTTIRTLNYGGYMFLRFLQGVGAGPAVVIGFGMIRDISWLHERGFNIGLWVMALDLGGVMGAIMGGFTASAGPFWANYHVVIAYGVLLLLEIFCLPETLYPRDLVIQMSARGESLESLRRTKNIKPWHLLKIPGVAHPRMEQSAVRFVKSWKYPRLVLGLVPYVFFQYWWVMSLLTMEPAAYENYKPIIQGLLFLGLVVGTIVAELFFSGRLSDSICSRLALKNNNIRTPEMRLWLGYPGALLGAIGAIIWGISVDHSWHWMVGQVGFFLFAAGMQLGNSSVSAYIVDCYPDHIMEIMTFYTVVYNLSAFIEPWFINFWVEAVGYTWCFVTQGLIILLLLPTYACLQKWGYKLAKEMQFD